MAPKNAPDRKCYGQQCTVARALDVVGDRWTLLIVRELLGGPARFGDLSDGLPGIAKNLLTNRLRQLEHDEVLRRVSAQGTTLYTLTTHGEALRPAVELLGAWGAKVKPIGPLVHARSLRSVAVALAAILARTAEHRPTEARVIELMLDDGPLELVLGPRPSVTSRPSVRPDARIQAPNAALDDFLDGRGLNERKFSLSAGDEEARTALLYALGGT